MKDLQDYKIPLYIPIWHEERRFFENNFKEAYFEINKKHQFWDHPNDTIEILRRGGAVLGPEHELDKARMADCRSDQIRIETDTH